MSDARMHWDILYLVRIQYAAISDVNLYCISKKLICKLLNLFRPSSREEKILAVSVQMWDNLSDLYTVRIVGDFRSVKWVPWTESCVRHEVQLTWGSKPISSILSASSRTKYWTSANLRTPMLAKSLHLPGVATTMSTPFWSILIWGPFGAPP